MSDVEAKNASIDGVSSNHAQEVLHPVADVDSRCAEQLINDCDVKQPDTLSPTSLNEAEPSRTDDVTMQTIAELVNNSTADLQPSSTHHADSTAKDDVGLDTVVTNLITLPAVDPPSRQLDDSWTDADKVINPVNVVTNDDYGPLTDDVSAERLAVGVEIPLDVGKAEAGSSSSATSKTAEDVVRADSVTHQQSVYQIKWVKWKDSKVPVITQNENGPCPLIAIMNVLLLLGKVKLSYAVEIITSDQLMEYLGDCILESAPKNISEAAQLNYEQNMHDAIAVLSKLQTGLDVNVKFTGVHDFEYTPECIIFDLLNIPLYHGWLVDPQARDIVSAVGKLSYNQLVEKIITNKSSSNSNLVTEALIAENFLEKSASQLTYYGLCELNEVLKANELAILFRNNHFSTVFKHEAELLQLVTDQGFLNESNVVWETLSNIEGDCQFVDANFATVPPKTVVAVATAATVVVPSVDLDGEEQIQHDYLVALSLQEEQKREEEKAKLWQEYKEKELGVTDGMTDEELARALHADEQRLANEHAQADVAAAAAAPADPNVSAAVAAGARLRQSSADSKSGKQEKKKSDCTIL